MELLYFVDITDEYNAWLRKQFQTGTTEKFDQNFLFNIGKMIGETGVTAVELKVYPTPSSNLGSYDVYIAFKNPEDASAFKLAWPHERDMNDDIPF